MKQPLSLDDHFKLSEKIHGIRSLLEEVRTCIQNKSGCSGEMKKIVAIENHIDSLRSMLDSKYHKVANIDVFNYHGHVYYEGRRHETTR